MGKVWYEVVRAKFPMNKQFGLRVTTMFRDYSPINWEM